MKTSFIPSTVLAALFSLVSAAAAFGQAELYVTNNTVNATALDGNTLYLGGDFTRVGPATGNLVFFDLNTNQQITGWPRINGTVQTIIPDGSGGWYVGGSFTKVGADIRTGLAHILSDKTLDQVFTPQPDGTVFALLLVNGSLYVGGDYSFIGGHQRNRLAALSPTTGVATSWNPDLNGTVRALAASSSRLYVGGLFNGANSVGALTRNRLASFDLATGAVNSWDPDAGNTVFALALSLDAATVYVGGNFTGGNAIGGANRMRLAAVDAVTGAVSIWNPTANASVRQIVPTAGGIFVGGTFANAGGSAHRGIVYLNPASNTALTFDAQLDDDVLGLAVSGSSVIVGGAFANAGAAQRNFSAVLNVADASATAFNPSLNNNVNAVAVSGTTVALGGTFSSASAVARARLAALDLTTGAVTAWNPGAGGTVYALQVTGGNVVVGGSFSQVAGATRNNAAIVTGSGTLSPWDPNVDDTVRALAVIGSQLYMGGDFTHIGATARSHAAAVDLTSAGLSSWAPEADGAVLALAPYGSTVVLGGSFLNLQGQARPFLGQVDTSGVLSAWAPQLNEAVRTLAVSGSQLYVGGDFDRADLTVQNNLVRYDLATGDVDDWNPKLDGSVRALSVGSKVLAGGNFTNADDNVRTGAVRLSVTDASADELNPDTSGSVLSVLLSGNNTILAGTFTSVAGVPLQGVANLIPFSHSAGPGKPSGSLIDGQTLAMTNNGTWQGFGGISYEWLWQRCAVKGSSCSAIPGALNSSYLLTAADVGSKIKVQVTASDALESSSLDAPLTGIVAPGNTVAPQVKGKAKPGSTLVLTNGVWDGVKGLRFRYAWQSCNASGAACRTIARASSSRYTVKSSDAGRRLRGQVRASKNGSAFTSAVSSVTALVH